MARIPDDIVREIQERSDILEIASPHLSIKRAGANYVALCPFHQEKTPSFNLNPARQSYHCFGCGEGGSAINLLMRLEGLSFPEAARKLADRYGIVIPEEPESPEESARQRERERFLTVTETASRFYQGRLLNDPDAEGARQYLLKRGYDRETAERALLGFAPTGWQSLLEELDRLGIAREVAEGVGLIRPGKREGEYYDLFRNRLIFPIRGSRGEVVAFGGRTLGDDKPKYINSTDSPLFNKRRTLYGLFEARSAIVRSGEALLVEGYFDRIALEKAGVVNAVATCGTALTAEHLEILSRYAKRLLLLFDQDEAGQQATAKSFELILDAKIAAAVVQLPPGDDPDSFVQREGGDAFRRRMAEAVPLMQFMLERILAQAPSGVDGRARAVEQILGYLKRLDSDIEKDLYIGVLVDRAGVDPDLCRRKLFGGARTGSRQAPSPPAPPPPSQVAVRPKRVVRAADRTQQWLVYLLATSADFARMVEAEGVEMLAIGSVRSLARHLVALQPFGGTLEDLQRGLGSEEAVLFAELTRGVDPEALPESREEILRVCRRCVEEDERRRELEQVDAELAQAERNGERDRHEALLRRRMELARRLKP